MSHDIAVLGGGIAGASAALRLAQGGARPLWIAPRTASNFKPGEHLSAAALPLLKALGSDALLKAEVHRHAHSTYSAWGSDILVERNAIVQLEGPPLVLDRLAFESALTDQALAAGAERITMSVQQVAVDEGVWALDVGGKVISAKFLIDATGRKAIVASKLSTRFQADKLCCLYAIYRSEAVGALRPVTLIEAEERGWWYLSVLADGRVVLNFYTDADLQAFKPEDFGANARATRTVSAYLRDYVCQIHGAARRLTTNSSWIAPTIGAGWAAIGDASAAFDPLSSHGMTTALWSAIQVSDAYLAQDREKMIGYSEAVAHGVQDYLQTRTHIYSQEQRWRHSPFWARRQKAVAAV